MLTQARNKLALELFDIGAVRFGAFKLKLHEKKPDAPLSPIYIDLRVLRSFPLVMDSAVEVYEELIAGLKFNLYADVPTAATPIVAILSHKTKTPMVSPRPEKKEHGLIGNVDGVFRKGQITVVIDDLVTTADSKLEAIATLEGNGLSIKDVVVLIDREQGGVQELEKRGYTCHVAFKLSHLLRIYLESAKISQPTYERTMAYLASVHN